MPKRGIIGEESGRQRDRKMSTAATSHPHIMREGQTTDKEWHK
jgi:hypothetical protein